MFSKRDIQYHRLGYGHEVGPAVNVKVYAQPTDALARQVAKDHGDPSGQFTLEWITDHVDAAAQAGYWDFAVEDAWETLQNDVDAEQVFDRPVRVFSEGRSGGWAMVGDDRGKGKNPRAWTHEDVTSWDAIAVARWAKFARFARETADDVPYQYLAMVYLNVFERWSHIDVLRVPVGNAPTPA